jgi:hypothetical protein
METITFKSGIYNITMDAEQIKKLHDDNTFLEEAIQFLLNKDMYSKSWDALYTADKIKPMLRSYFENQGNWNKDYLNKLFANEDN